MYISLYLPISIITNCTPVIPVIFEYGVPTYISTYLSFVIGMLLRVFKKKVSARFTARKNQVSDLTSETTLW